MLYILQTLVQRLHEVRNGRQAVVGNVKKKKNPKNGTRRQGLTLQNGDINDLTFQSDFSKICKNAPVDWG